MTQSGLVFNIQKYSVQDGPGIRTTVFLKGCPLCCAWCHNPEGISPAREVVVIENRCILCGKCREACPERGTSESQEALPREVENCRLCGACIEACPTEARQIVGREMTVGEVLEKVLEDRIFYDDSKGGVTFSGGEPLAQYDFLLGLLEACRTQGVHTAVDTCGMASSENLLAVARLADLILYDLKLMDEQRHREHTGVSNAPILANLGLLGRAHNNIWIRVPVLPAINDRDEDFLGTARFVASVPGVRLVCLLPYHRTGVQKARRLDRPRPLESLAPPTPEQLERAAALFRTVGLKTRVGG